MNLIVQYSYTVHLLFTLYMLCWLYCIFTYLLLVFSVFFTKPFAAVTKQIPPQWDE